MTNLGSERPKHNGKHLSSIFIWGIFKIHIEVVDLSVNLEGKNG
jgi:hypothetical protein